MILDSVEFLAVSFFGLRNPLGQLELLSPNTDASLQALNVPTLNYFSRGLLVYAG